MINIVFQDLSRCRHPGQYVHRKLAMAFPDLPTADLDRLSEAACAPGRPGPLPLLSQAEMPTLGDVRERSLARKVRLFTAAVDRLGPLLDEETLRTGDVCSVLKEDAGPYRKGTPVLVRDTSHATICYVFENVAVDTATGEVTYLAAPMLMAAMEGSSEHERHVDQWMEANIVSAAAPSAEKIVGQLAKGLVGLLPGAYGKVGAALLGFLIPSGEGIDYKQLLDDIGTIVADANRRQTIATQGGILNGVCSYINGNYAPQRDSGKSSKADLFGLLNPQLAEIYKVVGVLKQPEFEKAGISTFISAVTHKYLVYQEMALQDPTARQPGDSPKAQSIRHDVGDDVQHAQRVIETLQKGFDDYLGAWISRVTPVSIRITDCPKSEWYFRDLQAGYQSPYFQQSGCKDDPHARCAAARRDYIATVSRKYRSAHQDQLPWMREVVEQWRRLAERPLPSESGS